MKKTLRIFQVLAISTLIFSASKSMAQVKLGNDPTTINGNAILQMDNNPSGPFKGILFPKMTSIQRGAITNPIAGLYIFNITSNCFEFWDGNVWKNLCGDPPVGTSVGTLGGQPGSCAPIVVNGSYKTGIPLTGSNNAQVQVNITTPGTFSISTNTVNGVSFSLSSSFGSTGIQFIVLQGSGTPSAAGTFSYTVTYPTLTSGSTSCVFDVTFNGNTTVISSINCSGTPAGTYTAGVAMNASNTKALSVNVTTTGNYVISSTVQNGVAFSGTGTFPTTGANNITLTASGTPAAGGTFTYNVTAMGQTCSFPVTFTAPAIPNCANKTYTSGIPAPLINGQSYTGNVSIPYSNGNGTAYPKDSITISGISLVRQPGTFTNGNGSVLYHYSGIFTGTSNTYIGFNVNIGGTFCEVGMGDAIRAALSGSGAAYDNAAVDSWVPVDTLEYLNTLNTVTNSAKLLQTDATMKLSNAAAGSLGAGATFAEIPVPASNQWTQVPDTNYIFAVSFRNANGGQYSTNGLKIKTNNTAQQNGFVDCGNAFSPSYNNSFIQDKCYFFVRKRPTTRTGTGLSYVAFYSPTIIIGAVPGSPTTYYSYPGDATPANNLTGGTPTSNTTQLQLIGTKTRAW